MRWNGEQNDEPFLSFLSKASLLSFHHPPPLLSYAIFLNSYSLHRILPCHFKSVLLWWQLQWAHGMVWTDRPEEKLRVRAQQVKNKRLPPPQSLDNQVLVESTGRLKGGRVEAESTGASVGRGHLGPFESSQTSLHLTCSSDEKLSSVSAGHKSPLGSSVLNWRKLLCVCVCV